MLLHHLSRYFLSRKSTTVYCLQITLFPCLGVVKTEKFQFFLKKKTQILPNLILRCLNVLANCSNSSKSVVSSGMGSIILEGVFKCWGVNPPELGVLGVSKLAGMLCVLFGGVVWLWLRFWLSWVLWGIEVFKWGEDCWWGDWWRFCCCCCCCAFCNCCNCWAACAICWT